MNPLTIYQEALDSVSRAILAEDFDAYIQKIALPYLIHTNRATFTLLCDEDFIETFHNMHNGLKERGITHYERIGREARYVGRERIEGLHFTHMISGDQRIAAPHASRQVLIRTALGWRFSEAYYPIENEVWPMKFIELGKDPLRPPPPEDWGTRKYG
ncbi:MAG: hypothetical protein ACRCSU_05220 [Paracoccaceae bacterium]